MKAKKYYYSIDTKEQQEFMHNDFIYNMTKDLYTKANKENKTNRMYISEKQYNCLDRYSQYDGKRNYYITSDFKYRIVLHKGSKQGKYFYYISTKKEVEQNNNLLELLKADKKAIAAITIKEKNDKINSFCIIDFDYLEDLKEEEQDGDIQILELIYK